MESEDLQALSFLAYMEAENELAHAFEEKEEIIAVRLSQRRKMPNKTDRFKIMQSQNWRCNKCGVMIAFSKVWAEKYNISEGNIDHIHPFAERDSYEGDINSIENFQALCFDCNMKKGKKIKY